MLAEYVPLLWLFGLCGLAIAGFLAATSWFGPSNNAADTNSPNSTDAPDPQTPSTQDGATPQTAEGRFAVEFYTAALVFLVFSVAMVLIVLWAVAFQSLGWFGLWGILAFLFVISTGLIYVWKSGVFEWD